MIRKLGLDRLFVDSRRSTNESLYDRLDCIFGSQSVRDVEVGAKAHEAGFAWRGEHALARQRPQEQVRLIDLDEHDVRLGRLYSISRSL